MALDCRVMETRIRRPAALLLLGWVMLLLGGCSSLLFHPQRELLPNPVAARFTPQDVFFPSGDGETLHGWFFSAPQAKGTILAFHGNAENISTHVNGVRHGGRPARERRCIHRCFRSRETAVATQQCRRAHFTVGKLLQPSSGVCVRVVRARCG